QCSDRDAQYEGVVNDARLYSAGTKAAAQNQSEEYELSSQGNSATEEQVAHQYLAMAQATGAARDPQVFFTGLSTCRASRDQHRPGRPVVPVHYRQRQYAADDLDAGLRDQPQLDPGRLQRRQ